MELGLKVATDVFVWITGLLSTLVPSSKIWQRTAIYKILFVQVVRLIKLILDFFGKCVFQIFIELFKALQPVSNICHTVTFEGQNLYTFFATVIYKAIRDNVARFPSVGRKEGLTKVDITAPQTRTKMLERLW